MKRNILFFCLCLFALYSHAQVEGLISHQQDIQGAWNPAAAVANPNEITADLLYRNQWLGVSTKTFSNAWLCAASPLTKANSYVGINMNLFWIGLQRDVKVNLQYAYALKMKKSSTLGLGLGVGFIQTQLAGQELRAPDGDYNGGVNHNDNLLPENTTNAITPELQAGLFYSYKQKLGVGFSVVNLMNLGAKFKGISEKDVYHPRICVANLYYHWQLGKHLQLTPSVLYRTDFQAHQLEYRLMASYNNQVNFGVAYRGYNKSSNESVILLVGTKIKRMVDIGYSYDVVINGLNRSQFGTHEIIIGIKYSLIQKNKIPKVIYNPRFM